MLDTYRKLQANGAIGPMMKVGADGKPLWDPSGEQPGQLVVRPFQEYPKVVKRWKTNDPVSGLPVCHEIIAHSKAEELRIISERIEEFSGDERSPVEKERDELARTLADQQKINGELEARLNALMAQVEQLVRAEPAHPPVQPHGGLASAPQAKPAGLAGLSAEKKATLNQK
jgi:hypothetical protein